MTKIRRPDLEAAPVKFPGYIGTRLFPFLGKSQQGGTLYYQALQDDVAAQYGRDTASLASISATTLSAHTKTFSCSENRGRFRMSYDQVNGYRDLDHAYMAMGRCAKRSFYNKIETLVAKAALEDASATDARNNILSTLENAAMELQDLGRGDVCLAIAAYNFALLKKDTEIKARMQNTGVVLGQGGDPRNITAEQIAAILGVKRVYVGGNDCWRTGVTNSYRSNCVLFIEPDENEDPAENVQVGRTVYFEFDNAVHHFVMESFEDDANDAYVVDAKGQIALTVMNSGLLKTFQLFDAPSSSSSSSSSSSAG